MEHKNWNGFKTGTWQDEINVRDFIQTNYKEYTGDDKFLAGPTEATNKLWDALQKLQKNLAITIKLAMYFRPTPFIPRMRTMING